jgi:hypothetical protein
VPRSKSRWQCVWLALTSRFFVCLTWYLQSKAGAFRTRTPGPIAVAQLQQTVGDYLRHYLAGIVRPRVFRYSTLHQQLTHACAQINPDRLTRTEAASVRPSRFGRASD